MSRPRSVAAACLAAVWSLCVSAAGTAAEDDNQLPFVRVNVAADALADVPLSDGRYVPMPLEEFEDAIARLGPMGRRFRVGVASESRYQLMLDNADELSGTVEFRVGDAAVGLPGYVPLGRLTAGRCSIRTADGSGEAVVFCLPDGTAAVRTPGPGTYTCQIRLPRPAGQPILRLPLVPALVTTAEFRLPDAARPIVTGPDAPATVVSTSPADPFRWSILRGPVGPNRDLTFLIQDGRRGQPAVRAWNCVTIRGRQAELVAQLEPMTAWMPDKLELSAAAIRISDVVSVPDEISVPWTWQEGRLTIDVPGRLAGSSHAIRVRGVAAAGSADLARLPVLEPLVARWAGCNTRLAVDPSLALQRVLLEECRVVSPKVAASWPLPTLEPPAPAAGIDPALVFLEHESPGAAVGVAVGSRAAILDTSRVTTVDILPGTVLGRTAVDVRVVAGQVFGLNADVAPGWFIDSVATVDWATGREPGVSAGPPPEWRVVRSPRGSELRIGLPLAATPRRGLGLLINGHRSGLPLGAEFSSDDMDMLRFPGETAALEFQLGPNVVLEAAGGSLGLEPVSQRLEPLVARTAPRARIPAGERAPAARARLVRRRPPVEAEVAVDLVARDDRLAETFTFTCRPVAGELDAVVVHFSQPMPQLEWSLAAGDGGSVSAQPLDREDTTRGELRTEAMVAESWLVELRPATATAATFRAARTVPLAEAVSVPLAWVEAAERPGGLVTIRGEPGRRPTLINDQLRELPPAADGNPGVIKLAYGPPRGLDASLPVAAVAKPPTTATPRAWAWRQVTACWCFESGAFEWETSFDIENQGRESATITLPDGLRVEGVVVAGTAVAAAAIGPDMLGLAVPLPQAADRIKLVVRGSGGRSAGLGWWRLGGVACGIDMPVLDRQTTLMLPPGLETAPTAGATEPWPWTRRLLGSSFRGSPSSDSGRAGFRAVAVADPVAGAPIVIRKDLLRSLAIMMAAAAAVGAYAVARRNGPLAIAACGAAACTALWCSSPWDAVARGALWGGIVGTWAAGWRPSLRPLAACAAAITSVLAVAGTAPAAEPAPEPAAVRVYVTPGDEGGTALVPEELFRRLSAAAAAVGPPTVRVLDTDVAADVERGVWRVGFQLDADQGGELLLDQRETAAVWRLPSAPPPGLSVTLDAEGMIARIAVSTAGRYQLGLDVEPAVERAGDIDVAAIALPPAPQARLRLVEAEGAGVTWQCDRSVGDGPWLPVGVADGSFDLSAASRARLVRAADPRATVLSSLRAAVSFNDIAWQHDGCLLTATFDVGGERQIVRSLLVRADPALGPVATGSGDPVPRPLGGGRYLIELPAPRAGQQRVVVAFRMPLADPVGIFDAPFAWLAAAETDVRTVRLRPAPDLVVAPDVPAGITLVKPRDEDGAATTAVWRSDALAAAVDTGVGAQPRARIVVRRRDPQPAVVQDLVVEFAEDHVGLLLRCRLDTGAEPLLEIPFVVPPAAIIDGISLTREPQAEAAGQPAQPMDVTWSREAADRIVAVVQRPETGRFRLQLDARLPIRPARRGRLPLARIAAEDVPLELSCRTASGTGFRIELDGADGLAPAHVELVPGKATPTYVLSQDPAPETDADDAAGSPPVELAGELAGERAAATTVDLAIDGLGRAWGLVRFDVVAVDPVVRLVLPAGLRLFDVRADGREVTAVPAEGNAWVVRLHDVAWPRSLVAVIAGTLGGRLADGGAIRLEPPRLAGLPAGEVLWSVDTPAGFDVRVSEPARVLDAAAFAEVQVKVRNGLDSVFREAIRGVGRGEREPLESFASTRRDGGGPVGERSWYEAWRDASAGEPNRTLIAPGGDGSVTIRAVRRRGSMVPSQGLATAAILGVVFVSWLAVRRFPEAARPLAAVIRRWWWLACGAIWLAALQPAWPGLAMLLLGALLARWPVATGIPSSDPVPADSDSTLSFSPK
jgi:hypothetical protein